jgi:hypothetical protein
MIGTASIADVQRIFALRVPFNVLAIIVVTVLLSIGQATASQRDQSMSDTSASANENKEIPPVYSNASFLDLVSRYLVDDGQRVDYKAWKDNPQDVAAFDDYINMLALVSPRNHPEQFPRAADARSYWINAYNALVLHAVLEYWPLDSVRDVKLSLSSRIVPNKGFFYDRKVVLGGQETNLYDLEKEVLKNQKDPRLHFALNCASESCPVLRAWEWTDEQLDTAAREFVNKPENVAVENRTLQVSRIFKWYKKDFPAELATYLEGYADPPLASQLRQASEGSYPVRYREYDWSLNSVEHEE